MAFIGEIQIFGFGYAPPGWALCNGASLQIRDFTALFSLIGSSYGGDGTINFRLPNLAGRAACGQGQGNGQTQRNMGDSFGVNQVTLSADNAPQHGHGLNFFNVLNTTDPVTGEVTNHRANTPLSGHSLAVPDTPIFVKSAADIKMQNTIVALEGGSDAHENRQPFGALNYYIMTRSAGGDGNFPVFG